MNSGNLNTIAPLRDFVIEMTQLVNRESNESKLLTEGSVLLKNLIQTDSWLPD